MLWFSLVLFFQGAQGSSSEKIQPLQQPNLDPLGWFLTSEEIDEATPDFNRRSLGIADYTHGNSLTPLITGEPFMRAIYDDIELTNGHDDFIYLTGWLTRADVILLPQTIETSLSSKLGDVWSRAIARNVSSLSLVWRNLVPGMLDLVQ
jgi:hypothetical protein